MLDSGLWESKTAATILPFKKQSYEKVTMRREKNQNETPGKKS
jgi:hypothetical protein